MHQGGRAERDWPNIRRRRTRTGPGPSSLESPLRRDLQGHIEQLPWHILARHCWDAFVRLVQQYFNVFQSTPAARGKSTTHRKRKLVGPTI